MNEDLLIAVFTLAAFILSGAGMLYLHGYREATVATPTPGCRPKRPKQQLRLQNRICSEQ